MSGEDTRQERGEHKRFWNVEASYNIGSWGASSRWSEVWRGALQAESLLNLEREHLRRLKLMVIVKPTLTKYGYPPDSQQKAVDTVMKQAELMADGLVW